MAKINGALIGCGFFAVNQMHGWRDLANVEIVAICDRDPERLRIVGDQFGVRRRYQSADEMFADGGFDFVDIATTVGSHRALVELAASHKMPAICQKPFAPTLEDAKAMVAAADKAGIPLMIHENFRWQTPILAVKAVLDSGAIGTPFWGRVSFRSGFDVFSGQPYLAKGNRFIIEDLGIHSLDIARFLFGDASRMTARTRRINPNIAGEDVATMLLDHDSGVTSIVDVSYATKLAEETLPGDLRRDRWQRGHASPWQGLQACCPRPGGHDGTHRGAGSAALGLSPLAQHSGERGADPKTLDRAAGGGPGAGHVRARQSQDLRARRSRLSQRRAWGDHCPRGSFGMSEDLFRLYGTSEREPESRTLAAGALSAVLQDGNLRTLRFRGHEVLRAISFLVRDKDWGTCSPAIINLAVEENAHGFSVSYRARFTAPSGANLDCDIVISGTSQSVRFSANCISDADFETARAGFVVLHPVVGVAGEPVDVRHSDGSLEQARWPDRIEPWQPFKDIAGIIHRVAPGIAAVTEFGGDVFEMEDQRNWTDASYKTYVRPLALPWPYLVAKNEPFTQRISVAIRAEGDAAPASGASDVVSLRLVPTTLTFPEIGVGLRPECCADEAASLGVLKNVGARHLIAHFDPAAGHGIEALEGYAEIAARSGLKVTLELAVPCQRPLDEEMAGLAALVSKSLLTIDTLFVCPSVDRQSTPPGSVWPECPPLENIYAAARAAFPGVRLGGGMMSYFTELNRKRVPGDRTDYISHCTNPIVHAADDLSVMQTFEALRFVINSTRAIYAGKPYRIGPSTIAMRQNPYGSATKDNPAGGRIPMANVDPRHNGQFGAAWTLAYAATVAPVGLEVLTLSTLAGPFGLVAADGEPMAEGGLRPLAHVLARLGALSGEALVAVETSRPDAVLGLATTAQLLLANITPEVQTVALTEKPRSVLMIAADGGALPAEIHVAIPPYGCVEIVF